MGLREAREGALVLNLIKQPRTEVVFFLRLCYSPVTYPFVQ